MTRRAFLGALLLLPRVATAKDGCVRFLRPYGILQDNVGTRWIVQVERHPDHRLLAVTVHDGEFQVRRSDVQLEGEEAKRTHWIDWRSPLPAGELAIVATVYGNAGEIGRAVHRVEVIHWGI